MAFKKISTSVIFAGIFTCTVVFFYLPATPLKIQEARAYACYDDGTNDSNFNWTDTSIWAGCNGSYPGSPANGNSDTVTIGNTNQSGNTFTLNTSSITIASLIIGPISHGGTLKLNGNTLNVNGAVTIKTAANCSFASDLQVGTGTLNATGLITIENTAADSSNCDADLDASTGTITASGGITFLFTAGASADLRLTTTGATTINLTGAVTGAGDLSINSATTLVSTGTSSLGQTATWGKLSIPSGTLTMGAFAISFAGTTSLTGGTLAVSSATGTKTFTGAVTCTTGSFDLSGFATVTSFAAGITANCTTFNTGTGTAAFSADQSLAGSTNITFGGTVTPASTKTITNNNTGTVTVSGALTLTGNWTQGANSTLSLGATPTGSGTFDTSTNTPNTVKYTATSTLKAPSSSYYNLTITGGTVTTIAVTVTNNLVVSGGTLSGTSNITVNGGGVTGDGTITMSAPSVFLVDGTGNFGGATGWTFYDLTFGDGSGATTTTATGAGSITVTNTQTVAANQTLNAGSKTWNLTGVAVSTSSTYVQGCVNTNASNSVTCTMSSNITAGNLLVVSGSTAANLTATFSSSSGVSCTWNTITSGIANSGVPFNYALAYCLVPSTGAETIQISWSGSSSFSDITIAEYSNTSGGFAPGFDKSSNAVVTGDSTTCSTGTTATLSQANELVIALCHGWNGNATIGTVSGYTKRTTSERSSNNNGWYDKDVTSTTGVSWSATIGSDKSIGLIATFMKSGITGSQSLTVNGTFTASTSTFAFQNDMALTIPALTYYNLTLSPTITAARTYTFAGVTTVSNNFDINPTASSALALTTNLGGTLTVTGSTTIERTTSATSTLDTLSASNYALSSGSITISTGGTFTSNNSVITLTGTSGTLFTKTGTLTAVGTTSEWDVTSASGSPTLLSASTTLHILKINAAATVINLGAAFTTDNNSGNKLYVASGVLNQENRTITAGTSGTLQLDSGGTLCLGGTTSATTATCDSGATQTTSYTLPSFTTNTINASSTVIYLSNATTTVTSLTYGNLSLMPKMTTGVGSLTYTMPSSTVSITGNFNIKPTASNASLALTVNLATSSNTVTGTTTIQPDSTNSPTAKLASTSSNYNLTTGKVDIESNGTLDINNSTLTITGTSGTLFTRVGTFTIGGTSTTTFSGNGDATLNSGSITFDAMTNSGTGTKTLGAAITTGGALTISAGTIDVSASGCSSASCAVNVAGNFANSGTFTARTGTVTFNGTSQTIFGSTSFYNFTKSVSSADTLTFTASSTQTIAGTLTLQGASGQLLSLVSSSSPTQWNIDPQGTRTIGYLDVKDSNNTNATAITTSGFTITDSGHNTNWTFSTSGTTQQYAGGRVIYLPKSEKPKNPILVNPQYFFIRYLGPGDRGEDVLMLQTLLLQQGFFPATVIMNGYFGSITKLSVKKFQAKYGIRQTGNVGPLTKNVLNTLEKQFSTIFILTRFFEKL